MAVKSFPAIRSIFLLSLPQKGRAALAGRFFPFVFMWMNIKEDSLLFDQHPVQNRVAGGIEHHGILHRFQLRVGLTGEPVQVVLPGVLRYADSVFQIQNRGCCGQGHR